MQASRSGFSLIEIVIAVTIMAIAAALVVPAVYSKLRQSQRKTTKMALATVNDAIRSYKSEIGVYPQTLEDLKNPPADEKLRKRWEEPFIEKKPNDGYGNELQYTLNPKGSQPPYDLYSWGPSGEGSPEEEWIGAGEE